MIAYLAGPLFIWLSAIVAILACVVAGLCELYWYLRSYRRPGKHTRP